MVGFFLVSGGHLQVKSLAAAGQFSGIHRAPGALRVCGGRRGFCWLLGLRAFAERSERSRDGGGQVGSFWSLRRASVCAHGGGGGLFSSLCAPFAIAPVISPWLHLCSAVRAGGGPGACSVSDLAAWVGAPLSIAVATPKVVWGFGQHLFRR